MSIQTAGQALNNELGGFVSPFTGFRNRIINGDMRIDQRNAGAAVTTHQAFITDRFQVTNLTDGAFSAQQDSSAPTGFNNSVKYTTTTADGTLTATQQSVLRQRIEGFNLDDLAWGTANAQPVTLSFWVRSSLTGTFGGALNNGASDRSYPFTYTIFVADTWEYKTVTIAGDTSGTWIKTTGNGLTLSFSMGAGSDRSGTAGAWNSNFNVSSTGAVSVIGTLDATWYITGVQLEKGTVATPFEFRSIGQELGLCQRYFVKGTASSGGYLFGSRAAGSTSATPVVEPLPSEMRANPTITKTFTSFDHGSDSGASANTKRIMFRGSPASTEYSYFNGKWDYTASAEI